MALRRVLGSVPYGFCLVGCDVHTGESVAATTRTPNNLDLFELGSKSVTIGEGTFPVSELVTEFWSLGHPWGALVNWSFPVSDEEVPATTGIIHSFAQVPHYFTSVAVGARGALYIRGNWNGTPVGPTALTANDFAPAGAAVTAAQQTTSQSDAFLVGNDGKVYMAFEANNGSWHAPTPLTSANFAPPGAPLTTATQSGQLGVFVVANSGALEVLWWNPLIGWLGPTALTPANYVPVNAGLAAGTRASGELDIFAVGADGVLKYMALSGVWSGPWALSAAGFRRPAPRSPPHWMSMVS